MFAVIFGALVEILMFFVLFTRSLMVLRLSEV